MPKPRRPEHKKYPQGWRWKHGAWRYQVPRGIEHKWDGKREFTLGRTDVEAYKTWADRLELQYQARTIGDLLDRYTQQVVPEKAPLTQRHNLKSIVRLHPVFGHMSIVALRTIHAQQYLDKNRIKPYSANRDIELLSHAYACAVRWGLTEKNPIKTRVQYHREKPRRRYITDDELKAITKAANKVQRAYLAIKVLTGLRRNDILRLRMEDLRDDGIHVMPSKTEDSTGARLIIEWTDELHKAVELAKAARPRDIHPLLFCNRNGNCYVKDGEASGWESSWQRLIARSKVARFKDTDLRAKTASDLPTDLATALLGHADPKITRRVYQRAPRKVKPLR
jgi:integrase